MQTELVKKIKYFCFAEVKYCNFFTHKYAKAFPACVPSAIVSAITSTDAARFSSFLGAGDADREVRPRRRDLDSERDRRRGERVRDRRRSRDLLRDRLLKISGHCFNLQVNLQLPMLMFT
jgi:hypothetical protein